MAQGPHQGKARPRRSASNLEAPITPLRLFPGTKTVVLFGGSFDPITEYHSSPPLLALFRMRIQFHELFVPAAKSPLKPQGPVASDQDRVAMMRTYRSFSLNDEAMPTMQTIWTDEIDRAAWQRARGIDRPSYTIDTVRRLRSILPASITIRLLIGSDQAVQFGKWKHSRTLIRVAEPWVVLRPPHHTLALFLDAIAKGGGGVREQLAWARRVLPALARDENSTAVRKELPKMPLQLSRWSSTNLKYYISDEVKRYIIKHRLYGVGTKYKQQRKEVKSQERKPRVEGRSWRKRS